MHSAIFANVPSSLPSSAIRSSTFNAADCSHVARIESVCAILLTSLKVGMTIDTETFLFSEGNEIPEAVCTCKRLSRGGMLIEHVRVLSPRHAGYAIHGWRVAVSGRIHATYRSFPENTMDFAQSITAIVTIATLALMLLRPRGLNEAWFAAGGVGLLLLKGVLPWNAGARAMQETATVLGFLAGMMLITGIVEQVGVVEVVAERIAAICGSSTRVLYIAMFALSAVVTATMSLDITIIMMTPILFAVTRRRGLDPLPFLFACTFVANIGSLILPVSNLTNLLLVNRLDLPFGDFVRVMWLPNMVALLTTLLMFLWLFREQLETAHSEEPEVIPGVATPRWRALIGGLLVAVILALLVVGFAEWPIWIPAVAGAAVMLVLAIANRRITVTHIVHDLSLSLFVFVIAMTMLVQAIEVQFITGRSWL